VTLMTGPARGTTFLIIQADITKSPYTPSTTREM